MIAEVVLTHRAKPWRGVLLSCDCGNLYEVAIYDLLREPGNGHYPIRSCGCLTREKNSQGLSRRHELYGTWADMMTRCYNPKVRAYRDYGARGITVCEPWHNARHFIEDIESSIGPRPPGMTLDRIDNDSEYAPGKVQWATRVQQARNRRGYIDGQRSGPAYRRWRWLMRTRPDEVCEAWHDFDRFARDVEQEIGGRPDATWFARLDETRSYGPGNVTWITGAQHANRAQAARWAR